MELVLNAVVLRRRKDGKIERYFFETSDEAHARKLELKRSGGDNGKYDASEFYIHAHSRSKFHYPSP